MNSNVLEFWQAIEALTPQDALRVNPSDVACPVYGIKQSIDHSFPWRDPEHLAKPIEANMVWVYDAQCGLYETHELSALVVEALSRDVDEEEGDKRDGVARLFDLRFDHTGMPVVQSFSLSLSAWASGFMLRDGATLDELLEGGECGHDDLPEPSSDVQNPQSGFTGFNVISMGLSQWLAHEVERFHEHQELPSCQWLHALVIKVASYLNIPHHVVHPNTIARVRATRARKDQAQDRNESSEGLSSFYAADLQKITAAVERGDFGKGLRQFLDGGAVAKIRARVDVREEGNNHLLAEALSPKKMPKGRWPADHALAFSQQFAVNSIFSSLRNDAGLFSVNGPPGTGKTTLLRDIVAEVVTERASVLMKLGDEAFGSKSIVKIGEIAAPFYPLHESLRGFSIVVATNGNGAAENVTLEMPGRDAVPARVADRGSYFPELAEIVAGKSAWGLLAAPLGNRRNRTDFVSRFWWGQRSKRQESAAAQPMREHLRGLVSGDIAPRIDWGTAVARFKAALKHEAACRKRVSEAAEMPAKIAQLVSEAQQAECSLRDAEVEQFESRDSLSKAEIRLSELNGSLAKAEEHESHARDALARHEDCAPGLWHTLTTLGKARALWRSDREGLVTNLDIARSWVTQWRDQYSQLERLILDLRVSGARLNLRVGAATAHASKLRTLRAELESDLGRAMNQLGGAWLDVDMDQEQREHVTPWGEPRWLAAREEVFLAALDLHRAFFEAHPVQMAANLAIACDWLAGKRVDGNLVAPALESLCLVVPVVSATFASFPRMFAKAPRESIGYVLVDEGGQAQAAHVACAVWRARRTVIVGDPLQLEPVVTVPEGIESELARHYGVDTPWMPSWNSAQGLADLSSRFGTYLGTVPGDRLWVGCPLRLHRRCAPEMFRISNEVAYDGLMVFGTPARGDVPWPATAWYDVKATTSEGHWVDAEGQCLQTLIGDLLERGVAKDQVALISPFRDCAARLRRIARVFDLDAGKVGTVHTAQGKEADVVILILGGNPKSSGAKAWAASKPNLLNVAVSRGKKRLYVIGDRSLWRQHSYFSVMAHQLAVQVACVA